MSVTHRLVMKVVEVRDKLNIKEKLASQWTKNTSRQSQFTQIDDLDRFGLLGVSRLGDGVTCVEHNPQPPSSIPAPKLR